MKHFGTHGLVVLGLGFLALVLPACGTGGPRARAEAAALRRQTRELRRLLAAVEKDQVFSPRRIVVGVREELVRDLVQLTLPVETVVAGEMALRLEAAEVAFQGGESRVTLRGRVRRTRDPSTHADLAAVGGIHGVTTAGGAGTLHARVALDQLLVSAPGLSESQRDLLESLVEQLGAQGLSSLADQIPPLAIPVRFEGSLALAGLTAGPVTIAPAHISMRVEVAEVMALRGRLWVELDVSAVAAEAGTASTGGRP